MAINNAGEFTLGPVDEPLRVPTDFTIPSPGARVITTSATNNTQSVSAAQIAALLTNHAEFACGVVVMSGALYNKVIQQLHAL